jgi:acetyl-CoA acetyltransferase
MAAKTCFVMQGISADLLASLHGQTRTDLDAYAAESHCRAARAWSEGRFARSVVPVQDFVGLTLLERDETVRRRDHGARRWRALKPAFAEMGQKYGYDSVALQRYPQLEKHRAPCTTPATPAASSTVPPRCWWAARPRPAALGPEGRARASGRSPPSAPSRR